VIVAKDPAKQLRQFHGEPGAARAGALIKYPICR
jgi:hypothetical protein